MRVRFIFLVNSLIFILEKHAFYCFLIFNWNLFIKFTSKLFYSHLICYNFAFPRYFIRLSLLFFCYFYIFLYSLKISFFDFSQKNVPNLWIKNLAHLIYILICFFVFFFSVIFPFSIIHNCSNCIYFTRTRFTLPQNKFVCHSCPIIFWKMYLFLKHH